MIINIEIRNNNRKFWKKVTILDDQVKLTRLLQYTTGEARQAIEFTSIVGGSTGYEKAREILSKRFGDDFRVSEKMVIDVK